MAKKEAKEIKKQIDEILGAKSNLREKIHTKRDQERQMFCDILRQLQFVNGRTLSMKHDFKVNMMEYDDPFYIAIENLLKLNYTKEQRNLINWWLYDKYLPTGEVLILTHQKTEEVIPSDTPEEIWDLIMDIKNKNEKKNTK
tara:strand:- start:50 stop:475 length:426 start_codon:yes stop_codon:yes gene_type:complete